MSYNYTPRPRTGDWPAISRATIAAANGLCQRCGVKARVAHHLDKDSWNDAPENLAALCWDCHDIMRYGVGVLKKPRKLGKQWDDRYK